MFNNLCRQLDATEVQRAGHVAIGHTVLGRVQIHKGDALSIAFIRTNPVPKRVQDLQAKRKIRGKKTTSRDEKHGGNKFKKETTSERKSTRTIVAKRKS